MTSGHDADLFGEEIDYEQIWRDRYHQSCEQYEEIITISEGWVKRLSSDNDELQRQLRQAQAVIARLRRKSPAQEAKQAPFRQSTTEQAAKSRDGRDEQPASTEKPGREPFPPSKQPLRNSATSQASSAPFGLGPSKVKWWNEEEAARGEKRKRSSDGGEMPPPKKRFSGRSPPTTPPPSTPPPFSPSLFFSKPAAQRRAEASRAAAEREREAHQKQERRRSEQRAPPRHPPSNPPAAETYKRPEISRIATMQFKQNVLTWHAEAMTLLQNKSAMETFPTPPHFQCGKESCKTNPLSMYPVCECDVKKVFEYLVEKEDSRIEFLKKQRAEFHPDRFASVGEAQRERVQQMAKEVFVVVDGLYQEAVSGKK